MMVHTSKTDSLLRLAPTLYVHTRITHISKSIRMYTTTPPPLTAGRGRQTYCRAGGPFSQSMDCVPHFQQTHHCWYVPAQSAAEMRCTWAIVLQACGTHTALRCTLLAEGVAAAEVVVVAAQAPARGRHVQQTQGDAGVGPPHVVVQPPPVVQWVLHPFPANRPQ